MQLVARIAALLGRWPFALAAVVVLAGAVLLPNLNTGFWEPQERQLADRTAPRPELDAKRKADEAIQKAKEEQAQKDREAKAKLADPNATPEPKPEVCDKVAPPDAIARSLATRAPAWGRDDIDDSDGGRRLPFALLGLFTVLATAGIAMRTAGPRAGLLAAIIALSFPLLALQSRQLTSEIGTPCGGALIVYGLVALGRSRGVWGIVEAVVSLVAIAGGIVIGFLSGGALLGVLVPIGAFAAAGALGVPAIVRLAGLVGQGVIRLVGRPNVGWLRRLTVGRRREVAIAGLGDELKVLVATLAVIAVIAALAYQLYDIHPPYPGVMPPGRSILGHVISPTNCWSSVLGGLWKPEDDLRIIYDSTFEQIAYGTFPWGLVAPIAIAALIASPTPARRRLGALTLAWAGASWIASEAFQRKVGFTVWAGFPALAVAIGAWFDGVLSARRATTTESADALPPGSRLIALFVGLGVLDLGKDVQSFSDKLTSLFVGSDGVPYPIQSHLLLLQTRLWVFILGVMVALAFALGLSLWRAGDDARGRLFRRVAMLCATAAIGLTIVIAAFWSQVWQPTLGLHLSSQAMFETWRDLHGPTDQLVVMGDLGDAPHDYAASAFEQVTTREQIVTALGRPVRVFAVAPQAELCTLHRELAGKPYFVIDDRNTRSLLLSNRIDGATDENPLANAIVHSPPTGIKSTPKKRVVWDNKIELLGWDIPAVVDRGAQFPVKLYYKILASPGGAWTTLMHFDGPLRFNGDHKPINDRCPTSTWQKDDYIIDTYTVTAGGGAFAKGAYELWIGFFTGTAPNWKNMPISDAPGDMRDTVDRVKIMQVTLE